MALAGDLHLLRHSHASGLVAWCLLVLIGLLLSAGNLGHLLGSLRLIPRLLRGHLIWISLANLLLKGSLGVLLTERKGILDALARHCVRGECRWLLGLALVLLGRYLLLAARVVEGVRSLVSGILGHLLLKNAFKDSDFVFV